jgi:polyhydroxyalkanoate synthesis regulator phasin
MSEEKKVTSWRQLFDQMIELGLGAALLTKETAAKWAEELVKRGDVSREEGKKLVSEMMEKGRGQKAKMESFVTDVVERVLARSDLARRSKMEDLERRVAALEERLRQQGG